MVCSNEILWLSLFIISIRLEPCSFKLWKGLGHERHFAKCILLEFKLSGSPIKLSAAETLYVWFYKVNIFTQEYPLVATQNN